MAELALAVPMSMSPLAYYAAIGIAISVALVVVVWVVRTIALMPAQPPIERPGATGRGRTE